MNPRVVAARLRERLSGIRERLPRGSIAVAGTVLVLAVGGAVLARTLDAEAVVAAAAAADPRLLLAALVVYLLSWPVRGRRYGDILAPMGHRCRTGFLTAAVFASQTANLVVPARAGDGVRAYLLKRRREVPYPTGVASLAVERAFDLVALGALGGAGGAALAALLAGGRSVPPDGSGRAVAAAAGTALAAAALSAVGVAVARGDRRFGPTLRERAAGSRLSGAVDAAVRFGAAVRVVAADAGAVARVALASGVVWAADALTAVLVLAALVGGFGGGVDPATLLVVGTLAVSAGNLAKVLPLSQGGIGLYEAAFTGIVVAVTPVPAETALAAAALDHALKNAVTIAGGGVVAAAFDLSVTRSPDDPEPEPDAAATRSASDR
ncbi:MULTISPECIES: lysylphosphatidylglycerol synthase transmembrane domain-containing protein [Halorubrum]|nr:MULTISPECIES: lysylphosphatidylglycerol synthase transmembrane domain-containing protein [Halorubrum]